MGVTNIWHVLNLRATPFFQDALDPDEHGEHPLSLFVGRQAEQRDIFAEIGSATNSRVAIQGPPGVGKTTLVNYVKAEAGKDGYLVDAAPISVTSASSAAELRLAILLSVHDAIAARAPALARVGPMRGVRQLLDLEQSRSWSMSASIPLKGGAGIGTAQQRHTGPGALTVKPERLLRELGDIIMDRLRAPGIIVHLNNLENASEADQAQAARIIRDLRDTGLTYDGFHYLLAGTDDAIRTIVTAQEQLRSIFFNPGSLAPLSEADLDTLLEERYRYLRLFDDRPWIAPVEPAAVHILYRLFQGNLRGTLHALNTAAKQLIGRGEDPTTPMTMERMRPVLHGIYAQKLTTDLTGAEGDYLRRMANPRDPDADVVQKEAQQVFGLSSSAASEMFISLRTKGYLAETAPRSTGRPGRPSLRYKLTGTARLALGLFSATEGNTLDAGTPRASARRAR
jgi:hypothetical protein